MTQRAEIARRLGAAWAAYASETLAAVDARSGGRLTRECGAFRQVRQVLDECNVGHRDYSKMTREIRLGVLSVPEHIMEKHPEYWHLFFEPPTPAAQAALDQIEAARREAEESFGVK